MQRSESSLMSRLRWDLVKNSRDCHHRAIELFLLLLEDLPMVRDTASEERSNGRMQFGALIRSA